MGFFKIKRGLAVAGGTVQIGADTGIYRSAANVLTTDDGLTVAGTLTPQGAVTQTGGAVSLGGTTTVTNRLVVPYGTASPTIATNGQVHIYHKSNVAYLAIRSGGTPMYLAFPTSSDGTPTITIGGTP